MSIYSSTEIKRKAIKKPLTPLKNAYFSERYKKSDNKQICYSHPLGTITLATSKRIIRNELGEYFSITLPYLRFLDH